MWTRLGFRETRFLLSFSYGSYYLSPHPTRVVQSEWLLMTVLPFSVCLIQIPGKPPSLKWKQREEGIKLWGVGAVCWQKDTKMWMVLGWSHPAWTADAFPIHQWAGGSVQPLNSLIPQVTPLSKSNALPNVQGRCHGQGKPRRSRF